MSLLVAIACSDRIVMLSDGLVTDDDLGTLLDEQKLFKVTFNCAVAVGGEGIGDYLPDQLKNLHVKNERKHIKRVSTAGKNMARYAQSGDWMDDRNDKTAHIEFLVAGYEQDKPRVKMVFTDGSIAHDFLQRYYFGMEIDDDQYFVDRFGWDRYHQIHYTEAECAVMNLLLEGERKFPQDIGGRTQIWHIFPYKISVKSKAYIDRRRSMCSQG